MTGAFRENSDGCAPAQLLENRIERLNILIGSPNHLMASVNRNRTRGPYQPTDPTVGKKRRLGQELDGSSCCSNDKCRIKQRILMIGYKKKRSRA
jgi:hypothetical protein